MQEFYTCEIDGEILDLECSTEQGVLEYLEDKALAFDPDFHGEIEYRLLKFYFSGDGERVIKESRIQWAEIDNHPFYPQRELGTWNAASLGI